MSLDQEEERQLAQREETRRRVSMLRSIELNTRRVVNDVLAGQYHSVFKGRGIEFDQVRLYTPGDDIRSIDWNVTARAKEPYVRQYHEERELTVMLLVDGSASLDFGTRGRTKRELAAELAALLAFSAIRNNDKVGLLLFTDKVEQIILPKKGRKHVLRVVDEILTHTPQGRATDLQAALTYLSHLKIRRSVVFVISDFLETNFEEGLRIVGRRHDLVGFAVGDPAEAELPAFGDGLLLDPESGERIWADFIDPPTRRAYAKAYAEHVAELESLFRRHRLELLRLGTDKDYVASLVAFFRRRARKQ